jgi:glycerol-3-phosphate acyltransferase PlsY
MGLKKDIRTYGDGNPGAFNVLRAGGFAWAGLAIVLDISKGAVTVGLANYVFSVTGIPLIAAAIAPPLGHAFSPFLNFKGGKAIATVGGMWVGLSLWVMPAFGAIMLVIWYRVLTVSGWAVMFTKMSILIFLFVIAAPVEWFAAWGLSLLLLIYKHRDDLRQPIALKPRFSKRT